MGSYLGLPESMGGSKTQIFIFAQDRLNNRVNGLTFNFFSKGGKEVIIKSAVTSLPNHVMSCYQIPKTVKSQRGWRVLWHSSGEVQGEVLEVCIGNHRIRFVSKRRREVKGLKVLWILILRCWENNYGVWSRNQVLYFLVFLKIGISGMHHP